MFQRNSFLRSSPAGLKTQGRYMLLRKNPIHHKIHQKKRTWETSSSWSQIYIYTRLQGGFARHRHMPDEHIDYSRFFDLEPAGYLRPHFQSQSDQQQWKSGFLSSTSATMPFKNLGETIDTKTGKQSIYIKMTHTLPCHQLTSVI